MTLTILGVIAFQAYWLKQNYDREERTLALKTNVAFRETIMQLQAKNLKLDKEPGFFNDSIGRDVKVFMGEGEGHPDEVLKVSHGKDVAATLSIVSRKIKDSVMKRLGDKNLKVISMENSAFSFNGDSVKIKGAEWEGPGGKRDFVMRFLYSVDSLQDSLKLKEVESAYSKVLDDQKINIPFSVTKTKCEEPDKPDEPNKVVVGISNPFVFELVKGNTFSYLLKRIISPLLFSLFLIGLTVLSFVLLYRNMKKQQRLAELKNDFISNITHELKTPIATVGVAIEALKNFNAMQSPERTKEYLDISSNELQRLNLLVDKVLKLSMFEKKEIELNRETVDLKSLTDEVLASLRLQLEKKNASVTFSHSGDLSLRADRLHLLSVLFNLVDNAIKYSSNNPAISISAEEKENTVVMKIADNGMGVPDEYKAKVFEKFFRVPAGNVHNIKGYGLGLSYAASVIKKHGGIIDVKNNEGGGSVFIITLPK